MKRDLVAPLLVASTLSGLLLSGCAASSQDSVETSEQPVIVTETSNSEAQTQLSPLQEYLSLVMGYGLSPQESRQLREQQNAARQEFVATCMADQGFDYVPNPGLGWQVSYQGDPWRRDDPEWVAQWGYGLFAEREPGVAWEVPFRSPNDFTEDDPNRAIYENLSEGEQTAWSEALWGNGGCQSRAANVVREETPMSLFESDEFSSLYFAWLEMQYEAQINAIDADRDWSNCMADAGFPGLDVPSQASELAMAEIPLGQFRDSNGFFDPSLVDDPATATAIRSREIEIATTDLDCRIEVNYQARRDSHIIEVETQFVNDHRAELEALRDAAEQRGLSWLD